MWHNYAVFPISIGTGVLISLLVIWSLIWKGMALWKAARNSQEVWFIIMLIVNTLGILEIIYIFGVSKKDSNISLPGSKM